MPEFEESALDESSDEIIEIEAQRPPRTDHEVEQAYENISFRVIYQSNNFFLPQIKDLINEREVLNLRPEYQRRLRWSQKKKSHLIESLLLNVPIPPIFLFESDIARYEVMDGQQRLNAIHDYLENNYALTGLDKLKFLNGRRYNRLPPKLRRHLDRGTIGAIVLLRESKSDIRDPFMVRKYVFERLNTGGEKLNPQEIRNSIYRGPFNDKIIELTRNKQFCKFFSIPEYTETDENEYYENPERQKNNLYKRMGDCQLVLRFFALQDDEHISGAMSSILDNCMKRNKDADVDDLEHCQAVFEAIIEACDQIFDGRPFVLPPDEKRVERVSIALFDAITVALYRRILRIDEFIERKNEIVAGVDDLLANNLELLTGKANTAQSIKDRISETGRILDNLS